MRFVCRFWGRALLLLCCSTALWAQDAPLALEHAKAEISINGVSTFATVDLPYGWDFHHRGLSGVGQFDLSFDGPLTTDEAWGLYFYRLGNAYRVTLNGKLLEGDGDIAALGIGDYAKVPRFIRIPADLLLPHNQLEVVIRSDSGRRSGMPVVWVGPVSGVEDLYRKEFAFRVGGPPYWRCSAWWLGLLLQCCGSARPIRAQSVVAFGTTCTSLPPWPNFHGLFLWATP